MKETHEELLMLEKRINKMLEFTKEYSTKDPDACMNNARKIAEGICLHTIIKNEITKKDNLPKTLEQMVQCLKPHRVMDAATLANVSVLQTFGNMGSHYNNTALTNNNIMPALAALNNLLEWFGIKNETVDLIQGKNEDTESTDVVSNQEAGYSAINYPVEITLKSNTSPDMPINESMPEFIIENNALLEYTGEDKIVTVPQGITSIADCVFIQNDAIETIHLPEGLAIIGNAAFCDCPNLRSINFPESLVRVGNDAFFNCVNLEKVTLPKNLLQIGSNAFGNCRKITEVHIPARLSELHSDSFLGCISLKQITLDPESEIFCVHEDCLYDIFQEKLLITAYPKSKKNQ